MRGLYCQSVRASLCLLQDHSRKRSSHKMVHFCAGSCNGSVPSLQRRILLQLTNNELCNGEGPLVESPTCDGPSTVSVSSCRGH
jgi:hypothetical protein